MEKIFKNKNTLIKSSVGKKVVFTVVFFVFLAWALSLLYPLMWLFTNSLKHNLDYLDSLSKGLSFPSKGLWEFDNYVHAFKGINYNDTSFFGMFFNSIWTCFLSIGVNIFFSCCTGYVLAKYRFRGRKFIYTAAIVCMTLPIFGTGGVTYTFYYVSGMYNTPLYVIFGALGAFGMRFLMLYGFFQSVSWEYAEAVFLDGGGDFTVFFRIMLPIASPMIMALAVQGFITSWNAYEGMLLYMPSFPTVAVGIYKVLDYFESDMPVYYAAMIISLVPVVVLFSVFSDTIMKNFSVGGLKG